MPQLLGEYDCKIDAKGRVRIPSALLKQLGESESYEFVVNRGFEKCLMLYPKVIWTKITKDIDELNVYDEKNRAFVRYFYRGASEVSTDSAERLLFPKRLIAYAGITKEIVLFAYKDRVEVWDAEAYEEQLNNEPIDFSSLAQQVMTKEEDKKVAVEVQVSSKPGTGWTSDQ